MSFPVSNMCAVTMTVYVKFGPDRNEEVVALGGGVVGGCAHLLVAFHLIVYDMEKKTL